MKDVVGGDQFKERIAEMVAELTYQANWFHSRNPSSYYKGVLNALSRTTVLGGPSARDIEEARNLVKRMNRNYNTIGLLMPLLVHLRRPESKHITSHYLFCYDALREVIKFTK